MVSTTVVEWDEVVVKWDEVVVKWDEVVALSQRAMAFLLSFRPG